LKISLNEKIIMEKIIKKRTKFLAVIVILLFLAINLGSVYGTLLKDPSGITPGSGLVNPTYLENSKGITLPATNSSNFQWLVWNLNDTKGGWIHVPAACNVSVTKSIYLISNLTIEGGGSSSVFYLAPLVDDAMFYAVSKSNISISRITINMNNWSQTQPAYLGLDVNGLPWYAASAVYEKCSGIYMKSSSFITISFCNFLHGFGALILSNNTIHHVTVEHCNFWDRARYRYLGAVALRGSDITVNDIYAKNMYGSAVRIEADTSVPQISSRRNIIENCRITGETAVGVWMEATRKSNASIITNVQVYDINSTCFQVNFSQGGTTTAVPKNYGVYAMNQTIITGCYLRNISYAGVQGFGDVLVDDNILIDCGYIATSYCIGLETSSIFTNGSGTASNNHIYTSKGGNNKPVYGITGSGSYIVKGNKLIFSGATIPGVAIIGAKIATDNLIQQAMVGISVDYKRGAIIAHNNISKCTAYGIEIKRSNFCLVNSNNMNAVTTGIRVDRAANNSIKGNIVTSSGNGITEVVGAGYTTANNSIKDNILTSCTTKITKLGTTTIVKDNIGYKTENYGTSTITATTYVRVTHKLAKTPTCVIINPSTSIDRVFNVNTTTSTYFDVRINASGTASFYWFAKV